MGKTAQRNILIIPNEDGFGPSSLISHVANAYLAQAHTHITIWNESKIAYNQGLFADAILKNRLDIVPVSGIIQLVRQNGEVSISDTLRKIGDYRVQSDKYPDPPPRREFDLVIDFGVPTAARWANKNGLNSVTIFDHSWSKTLEMILAEADKNRKAISRAERSAWQSLIREIREDETCVQHIFLFPRFICPDIFYEYWETILPKAAIHEMLYVLGGNTDKNKAPVNLTNIIGPLPDKDTKLILIQAGGSPVWDNLLPKIARSFLDSSDELAQKNLLVVINVPARLKGNFDMAGLLTGHPKWVRGLEYLSGGTIQEILPAFDLMVTRAGGGSVNDAIACRVPFVCVEEHLQAQIAAILDACEKNGLTRRILMKNLEADPKNVILAEYDRHEENDRIRSNMQKIPSRGEAKLIDAIGKVAY